MFHTFGRLLGFAWFLNLKALAIRVLCISVLNVEGRLFFTIYQEKMATFMIQNAVLGSEPILLYISMRILSVCVEFNALLIKLIFLKSWAEPGVIAKRSLVCGCGILAMFQLLIDITPVPGSKREKLYWPDWIAWITVKAGWPLLAKIYAVT